MVVLARIDIRGPSECQMVFWQALAFLVS